MQKQAKLAMNNVSQAVKQIDANRESLRSLGKKEEEDVKRSSIIVETPGLGIIMNVSSTNNLYDS